MKTYFKYCDCGKKQTYSTSSALSLAKKKKSKCRSCATIKYAKRKGNLELFEQESLEFYYWLGFIMADGHISNNRLKITLAEEDEKHLLKLCRKLELDLKHEKNGQISFSVMNKIIIGNLVKKYEINSNKTIHPCNIKSIKDDKLTAFKIGFIDGDGNIRKGWNRKHFFIRVKCHKNWLSNLKYMFSNENCYINNQNYACVTISNSINCKKLKNFALNNKLPILNRKWDNIDLGYTSKQELSKQRIKVVKNMLNQGKSRKDIMNTIGISKSGLSLLISRNDL